MSGDVRREDVTATHPEHDQRGQAWWTLTHRQREVLEMLADDLPHRTGQGRGGGDGHVHSTMASKLERLGLVRYERCEHCGRGPNPPEVRITEAGLTAVFGRQLQDGES